MENAVDCGCFAVDACGSYCQECIWPSSQCRCGHDSGRCATRSEHRAETRWAAAKAAVWSAREAVESAEQKEQQAWKEYCAVWEKNRR